MPDFQYTPSRSGKRRAQQLGNSLGFNGLRLATARLAAGLTQEQVAQALATEQTRVSEWERGAKAPRPEIVPKLAAAVGLTALDLLAPKPSMAALEDLRLAAGRTPQQVADALGISLRRYRGVETGSTRRSPSDDLVQELAAVLGTSQPTVQRAIKNARGV